MAAPNPNNCSPAVCSATGSRSQVLIKEEQCYGVEVPNIQAQLIPFVSEGVQASKNLIPSATIQANRSVNGLIDGNFDVGGDLNVELLPEGLELIYKHALGTTIETTGSGPYTHVIKASDLPTSLTYEKGFNDILEYFRYTGMRINTLNLTFPQEGIPTATVSFVGAREDIFSGANGSMDSTPTVPTKPPFEMRFGSVYEDGVKVAFITSGNVQITNNISTDEFVIGSEFRVCATEGKREITGSVEILFQDLVMYNKFRNGTDSSIEFRLINNTTGDEFRVLVPAVRFSGETPTIDDDTGIRLTMNFQGKFDETLNTDMQITLVNTIPSI